jgi:hypothetical protein
VRCLCAVFRSAPGELQPTSTAQHSNYAYACLRIVCAQCCSAPGKLQPTSTAQSMPGSCTCHTALTFLSAGSWSSGPCSSASGPTMPDVQPTSGPSRAGLVARGCTCRHGQRNEIHVHMRGLWRRHNCCLGCCLGLPNKSSGSCWMHCNM